MKTVDEHGSKVFINVCASSAVAAPGGWGPGGALPPAARRYLAAPGAGDAADQAGSELLRVPLSMAEPCLESDHRGEPCTGAPPLARGAWWHAHVGRLDSWYSPS